MFTLPTIPPITPSPAGADRLDTRLREIVATMANTIWAGGNVWVTTFSTNPADLGRVLRDEDCSLHFGEALPAAWRKYPTGSAFISPERVIDPVAQRLRMSLMDAMIFRYAMA